MNRIRCLSKLKNYLVLTSFDFVSLFVVLVIQVVVLVLLRVVFPGVHLGLQHRPTLLVYPAFIYIHMLDTDRQVVYNDKRIMNVFYTIFFCGFSILF